MWSKREFNTHNKHIFRYAAYDVLKIKFLRPLTITYYELVRE